MSSEDPKTADESPAETDECSTTVALRAAESSSTSMAVQPAIFKLNVDCLHEIFEWISINDLMAIAETCKRLYQAAGDFYRSNYVSCEITLRNGSIYNYYRKINIFIEYIPRISISCNSMRLNRLIGEKCKSLRYIRLMGWLFEDRIEHLKGILRHVDTIDVVECPNHRENFYEFFLQHCSNVRSLSIERSFKIRNKATIVGSDNDWMLRTYPTLKHLELLDLYTLKNNELRRFFQQNPKVRTFSTDSYSLFENRQAFLSGDIRLDRLAIEFFSESIASETIELLSELHERGLFKRLHVYVAYHAREYTEQILSMPLASNALEMFHGSFRGVPQPLKNLKILGITFFEEEDDPLSTINISQTFPNLERIYVASSNIYQLSPFICDAPNLKAMKIKRFGGLHNLMELNRQREQLEDAKRLTIYVHGDYLRLRKCLGQPTKCSLIELRRYEACEWNDLNAKYRQHKLEYY